MSFLFRWAFKYGDDILACLTIFGNIYVTHKFRRELKLLPYARLTCYLPVVGIGALSCYIFNNIIISSRIVKSNKCPLCVSTRATLGQIAFGLAYPLVAATTVCFFMADRLLTYPVPPLTRAPREVFNLAKRIVLKNPRPYLIIGAIHMIASAFITFQKHDTLMKLQQQSNRNY